MTNCEIELGLPWSKECIISDISIIPAVLGNSNDNPHVPEVVAIQTTRATFWKNNAKLYVSVVTLSINDNIKLFKNLKQGLKRTISWNKYRSEIATQTKSNNLDYLIAPTFRNINRLSVFSFENGNADHTRDSFDKYYMSLVEIKDFNVLINNKPFFDQPVKNKQEAYEKHIKILRNDD